MITSRKIWERFDIWIATAETIVCNDLSLGKIGKRKRKFNAQKKQKVECSKYLLKMFAPDWPERRRWNVVISDET